MPRGASGMEPICRSRPLLHQSRRAPCQVSLGTCAGHSYAKERACLERFSASPEQGQACCVLRLLASWAEAGATASNIWPLASSVAFRSCQNDLVHTSAVKHLMEAAALSAGPQDFNEVCTPQQHPADVSEFCKCTVVYAAPERSCHSVAA